MRSILYFTLFYCITVLVIDCAASNIENNSIFVYEQLSTDDKAKTIVDEWRKEVESMYIDNIHISNLTIYLVDLKSYNRMINYGLPVIPYIIELG